MNSVEAVPGSFRDPSGFLFYRNDFIYRQVNKAYREDYDHLMRSGLYEALAGAGLLISHREADAGGVKDGRAYKIIQPERVPFISYPYEWCFSQLKAAALITLKIQKRALDFGMSLKDCSAYNIQFMKGKPVFIDTLSFEKYREGEPWVAYRQFCQHFLAPLALTCYRDGRLNRLSGIYMDGVDLDLASSLLPIGSYFSFPLLTHIHLHARFQKYFVGRTVAANSSKMSRTGLLGLIDNLESVILRMRWRHNGSRMAHYYEDTNYSHDAFRHKKKIVAEFLDRINPKTLWDLGANTGLFSRIAGGAGTDVISFDADPACVEKNYLECAKGGETRVLPLVLDLTNPSPGVGWGNMERMSLLERGPADAALALALIHHLAIANNLPLGKIADFFSRICGSLIIEFVPKSDSQTRRLLSTREDIFEDYTRQAFEEEFRRYFRITGSTKVEDSERTVYLMSRHEDRL